MANLSIEIVDSDYKQLEEFCSQTGISKDSLVNVLLKNTLKNGAIPFKISLDKKNNIKQKLEALDSNLLTELLSNEDIFIITTILSKLPTHKAASIIDSFQPEIQVKVIEAISKGLSISEELQEAIIDYITKKAEAKLIDNEIFVGGIENTTEILNLVKRATEKNIIETLEEKNQILAEEIKKRIFVFEDITILDDRSTQKVLREVDALELAKALKNADENVKDKIFKNMSKRTAEMLKEEMEFMGPVRLKDVEEVQMKFVSIIRRLEDSGEIVIARSAEDTMII